MQRGLCNNPLSDESRALLRDYSIIISITLATVITFGILKISKNDVTIPQALSIAFAGYIGKLTADGIYLSDSKK